MKSLFSTILICFSLLACGKPSPDHAIYGKWKSKGSNEAIFTFTKDNTMRVETFDNTGKPIFKESRGFVIYDENTVRIIDDTQPEYRVRVYAELTNQNEISLQCTSHRSPRGTVLIDHSNFCNFSRLEKISE